MKIRLMGLPEEVDAAVEALRQTLEVVEVSDRYPNRGNSQQVRVYVEARPRSAGTAPGRVEQQAATGEQALRQVRRVREALAWARLRIKALRDKRDALPEPQRAARKALGDRAHDLEVMAHELEKALRDDREGA